MQKKDSRDMKSKIASDAVNEYKGDPYIMDKTRKWAEETYKDQLKEEKNKWNESQKKKMDAQKKKYEGKLTSQKQQYEKKIEDLKEENNRNLIDQKTQIAVSLLSSKKNERLRDCKYDKVNGRRSRKDKKKNGEVTVSYYIRGCLSP